MHALQTIQKLCLRVQQVINYNDCHFTLRKNYANHIYKTEYQNLKLKYHIIESYITIYTFEAWIRDGSLSFIDIIPILMHTHQTRIADSCIRERTSIGRMSGYSNKFHHWDTGYLHSNQDPIERLLSTILCWTLLWRENNEQHPQLHQTLWKYNYCDILSSCTVVQQLQWPSTVCPENDKVWPLARGTRVNRLKKYLTLLITSSN